MFKLDSKGFSLLELLVVCSIVAVLAGIAVPKVSQVMAQARSARIEADLTTIDAAVVMYQTEKGKNPSTLSDMSDYLNDADKLKPPTGKVMLRGGATFEVTDEDSYKLVYVAASAKAGTPDAAGDFRATVKGHTSGEFGK